MENGNGSLYKLVALFETKMKNFGSSGAKIYTTGLGHTTKMAAMPIYGKNLKKLLPQNQMTYGLETWYVPSGTRVLPRLFR